MKPTENEIRKVIQDYYDYAMGYIEDKEYTLADANIEIAEALRWSLGEMIRQNGDFEEIENGEK